MWNSKLKQCRRFTALLLLVSATPSLALARNDASAVERLIITTDPGAPTPYELCTGTFFEPNWMLSAAHCFLAGSKKVEIGSASPSNPQTTAEKVFIHPRYVIDHESLGRLSALGPHSKAPCEALGGLLRQTGPFFHCVDDRFDAALLLTQDSHDSFIPLADSGLAFETGTKAKIFGFAPTADGIFKYKMKNRIDRFGLRVIAMKKSPSWASVRPGFSGGPLIVDHQILAVALAVSDPDKTDHGKTTAFFLRTDFPEIRLWIRGIQKRESPNLNLINENNVISQVFTRDTHPGDLEP